MDLWQEGIGRLALAKRADGSYAASVGGVVLSIPRQVGKTYLIAAIVFALCTLFPNLTVIWTAHRTRTHNETFKKMQGMAAKPKIAPYVENIRATNGEQEISFKNGSRILFGARESGFGRGFDKVDILVLDEAQILTEDAMSDMVPATNAAPNGLVFLMGTPPRPKDPGEVFTNVRRAAIDGDSDTLYIEFSADEGASLDDRKQLAKANPSYPHRTGEAAIQRMRKLLGSDDNFRREAYGIWDEAALTKKAINVRAWSALAISPEAVPTEGQRVFGVRFTVDGSAVALAAAIRPDGDAPVHVEGIKLASTSEGTQWLADWLIERHERAAQIVIDGKSGVGYLVNALLEAKVPKTAIVTAGTDHVITSASMVEAAIVTGGLTHRGQPELDEQVKDAEKRKIGTNGGFGWAAPEGGSVALLDAVTLAFWGAKTTKRRAGRKAVFL
ncbi:terminase large subunit domain-containing protein [Sinomonas susongensis]|uniref:terminase large subunit domain-containing protein n=1 Tax=Sinomonas susongensis TaxID=1324851 RepID=UPI001BB1EAC4|nr:terminase family protein [Sinomonas susongensis]